MEMVIISLVAMLVGAAITAVVLSNIIRKNSAKNGEREEQILELTVQNSKLMSDNEHLATMLEQEREGAAVREQQNKSQLEEIQERYSKELKEREDRARADLLAQEEKSKAALKEQIESSEKQLKIQMDALKLAFSESAEKLFEEKSKGLNEMNSKDMKSILDPLKEKMDEFRKEVQETKDKSVQNTATIEAHIKTMAEKAATLGKEANNLASALKGNHKIQGNWGETHLEKLLQDAGFVENIDYYKQEMIRNEANQAIRSEETGKKMIPDFIVTFPDKKVVIIDSKVSLTAYIDYCNQDSTPEQVEDARKRHIESVKAHVNELSRKDYAAGIRKTDKNSLKYVIMYIPNEGAFQLFFQDNKELWNEAFGKNVIITGDFYIITMLAIIRFIWDEHERQRNTEAIANTASELLERVNSFITTFYGIGKSIDSMKESFEKANNRLFGRGAGSKSVAVTSEKLQKLGIDCKTPLPAVNISTPLETLLT